MSQSKISQAILKLSKRALLYEDQEKLEKLSELYDELTITDIDFFTDYRDNTYYDESDMQDKEDQIERLDSENDELRDEIEALKNETEEKI